MRIDFGPVGKKRQDQVEQLFLRIDRIIELMEDGGVIIEVPPIETEPPPPIEKKRRWYHKKND